MGAEGRDGVAATGSLLFLWAWGDRRRADRDEGEVLSPPVPRSAGCALRFVQLACGERHSLALSSLGEVFCWGEGLLGALGLPDAQGRASPTRLNAPGRCMRIAAAAHLSAAAGEGGGVWWWGSCGGTTLALPFLQPELAGARALELGCALDFGVALMPYALWAFGGAGEAVRLAEFAERPRTLSCVPSGALVLTAHGALQLVGVRRRRAEGQLEAVMPLPPLLRPPAIAGGLPVWVAVGGGRSYSVITDSHRRVFVLLLPPLPPEGGAASSDQGLLASVGSQLELPTDQRPREDHPFVLGTSAEAGMLEEESDKAAGVMHPAVSAGQRWPAVRLVRVEGVGGVARLCGAPLNALGLDADGRVLPLALSLRNGGTEATSSTIIPPRLLAAAAENAALERMLCVLLRGRRVKSIVVGAAHVAALTHEGHSTIASPPVGGAVCSFGRACAPLASSPMINPSRRVRPFSSDLLWGVLDEESCVPHAPRPPRQRRLYEAFGVLAEWSARARRLHGFGGRCLEINRLRSATSRWAFAASARVGRASACERRHIAAAVHHRVAAARWLLARLRLAGAALEWRRQLDAEARTRLIRRAAQVWYAAQRLWARAKDAARAIEELRVQRALDALSRRRRTRRTLERVAARWFGGVLAAMWRQWRAVVHARHAATILLSRAATVHCRHALRLLRASVRGAVIRDWLRRVSRRRRAEAWARWARQREEVWVATTNRTRARWHTARLALRWWSEAAAFVFVARLATGLLLAKRRWPTMPGDLAWARAGSSDGKARYPALLGGSEAARARTLAALAVSARRRRRQLVPALVRLAVYATSVRATRRAFTAYRRWALARGMLAISCAAYRTAADLRTHALLQEHAARRSASKRQSAIQMPSLDVGDTRWHGTASASSSASRPSRGSPANGEALLAAFRALMPAQQSKDLRMRQAHDSQSQPTSSSSPGGSVQHDSHRGLARACRYWRAAARDEGVGRSRAARDFRAELARRRSAAADELQRVRAACLPASLSVHAQMDPAFAAPALRGSFVPHPLPPRGHRSAVDKLIAALAVLEWSVCSRAVHRWRVRTRQPGGERACAF